MSTLRHLFWFVLVMWWTTLRHEVSHAFSAVLEGAEILQVRLLPGMHDELGFYFGYVEHSGDVTWLTDAAPFIIDFVLLLLAAIVLRLLARQSRWWFYVFIFGLISPLVDLIYGYQSGLWCSGTDVADLFKVLPGVAVHVCFLAAISAGAYIVHLSRRDRVTIDDSVDVPKSVT